jgi:hypothetical protein
MYVLKEATTGYSTLEGRRTKKENVNIKTS